jgi:hypothetical protein
MNDPQTAFPAPNRAERLLEALHRYRYVLAPISFGAGLASFLLIERREWLAQWVSVLLILGWLLIVAEETAARRLRLSPAVLRFGVQAIQQETFFFALPFFLHTTTWSAPQAAFTAAALLAGVCSMWDPLYYGQLARRPWLYLLFHAFAVFVGTLVVAPILLHLTTTQTVALAAAAIAVLAVPSLLHLIDRTRALHWLMLVGGAAALGAVAWQARPYVPPATLWAEAALVTDAVNPATREPGTALWVVPVAHLHEQGLYAFTAIHAPRGLREQVFHRWIHEGREVDRIALDIIGGRERGYRAWSYKRGFPSDPGGQWRIDAVTAGGQLISRMEFQVIGAAPPASSPGPAPSRPAPSPQPLPAPSPPRESLPESAPDPMPSPEAPLPEDPAAPEPQMDSQPEPEPEKMI